MKIAIITLPLLNNYGGVLQNFSLQNSLKNLGHEPITIDSKFASIPWWIYVLSWIKTIILVFIPGKRRPFAKIIRKECRGFSFESFIEKHINKTEYGFRITKKLPKQIHCEAILVGSDQVWRPKYNHFIKDMYLKFAQNFLTKRISYAASFGVDEWEYTPKQTKVCSALAKKFNAISVREESGVKLCKEHLGVDATWVLDPTLLLKKEDYLTLCQDVPVNSSRFMAVYVLNLNDSVKATYESIAKEKNLEVKYFAADANATLSVPEWLAMFRDAAYVVTDSFHGTVFSIIFEKEFKCIYNETRGAARFESLLNLYNSGKLEEMREFSLNWLKNALES